jgi:nucleoside-diphosphate-sugar epimerase
MTPSDRPGAVDRSGAADQQGATDQLGATDQPGAADQQGAADQRGAADRHSSGGLPGGGRPFGRCLVIGGAGMLGFEIVRQAVAAGAETRILDLQCPPGELCDFRQGDMCSRADLSAALSGLGEDDVVFQTAAAVWDTKTPEAVYEQVNVQGNRLVLEVCREAGLRRLVYTSTIDVVVEGRRPIVDGDESLPYPKRLPRDAYSRTKIAAERLVLAASGPSLATCALRPVGMYGPRDRYHLGNILAMARKGNKIRLGDGSARFSHVYSENVAHAHMLAAAHLFPGSKVAGQAYFKIGRAHV